MSAVDWDRVLYDLEQFLITGGAADYLHYFLKSMYSRIRSGEIVVILAPIDVALARLVSRSRKSLDQISSSSEGRSMLENFLSPTPIKQTPPVYLAINGSYLATTIDLDKLSHMGSIFLGNLFVGTVDGIINMPGQLESLQEASIGNVIVPLRSNIIGDNVTTGYNDLPNPMIRKIALNLSLNDIVNSCRTSILFNSTICDNENFWNEKTRKDFPRQQTMINGSWKETYRILSPKLYTFGSGSSGGSGGLGYYIDHNQLTPKRVEDLTSASFVSCGLDHTAVISNGKLYTFGYGGFGELGHGNNESHARPKLVEGLDNVTGVACGARYTAAISNGQLYTFGINPYGGLGHGEAGFATEQNQPIPKLVEELNNVTMVSCGNYHTAVISNGQLYTFGLGQDGELGHGDDRQNQLRPKLVEDLDNVTFVACGGTHTAVISNSRLYTFGLNNMGQLGHGDLQNRSRPTLVTALDDADFVACSRRHTAVLLNGRLYTFGEGRYGELGHNRRQVNEIVQRSPELVKKLYNVTYVSCGDGYTAAVSNDQLYTFGRNSDGQLGNGYTGQSFSDIKPLTSLIGVTMVSCGENHTAVLAQ